MNGPLTADSIRSALSFVPSHDRDLWIRCGMAVKSELGDAGFDIWDSWSSSADNYNPKDARDQWRSFKETGKVRIGSLIYEAKQRGYKPNGDAQRMDPAEIERHKRERAEAVRREEFEREQKQKEAMKLAQAIYSQGQPATDAHPYLKRKGVKAYRGVRVSTWAQRNGKRDCLLIPIRDEFQTIRSLQAIFPDFDAELERDRDYLWNGRKEGCYFSIGKPEGAIVVCEGYATGASIHDATGLAVAVAFDKGNLSPVGKTLRARFPEARIIFAADNDITQGKPNWGMDKAIEAARAVGGVVAVPELDGQKADFNDLHKAKGAEAVKAAIEAAKAPGEPKTPATMREPASGAPGVPDRQKQQDAAISVELVNGSAVKPEAVRWVWDGWLARGKLHMCAGKAGTGKTSLSLALAATITKGGRFPDGTRAAVGSVLIWSGEDDIKDSLVPRLIACGADMAKVYFVGAAVGTDGQRATFDPAKDVPALLASIGGIPDLALLIVDPVVSVVVRDSHHNAEVRRALSPLVELASKTDCAMLGISHFSKGTAGQDPVERVTGSVAFGALPRVVMAAAKRSDEQGGGRMLVRAKSNIGPDEGGFVYELEQAQLPGHPGIFGQLVTWRDALEGRARELLATAETVEDEGDRASSAEAADLLLGMLKMERMEAVEAKRKLQGAGYSDKQIRTARERGRVHTHRDGFGNESKVYWVHPERVGIDCPKPGSEGDQAASTAPYLPKNPIDALPKERASMGEKGKYGSKDDAEAVPEKPEGERL